MLPEGPIYATLARPRRPALVGRSGVELAVPGRKSGSPVRPRQSAGLPVAAVPFVHLHVHSEYSILDGACRIPALVEKAARLEMPAVALTDHGSLAGAVSSTARPARPA